MKQCKALIRKEWQTHYKGFLIPLWFVLGVWAMMLISMALNLARNGVIISGMEEPNISSALAGPIMFGLIYALMLGFGGLCILISVAMAESVINGDFRRKCEILHLSQPVSLFKILGAKFALVLPGSILLMLALGLLNSTIIGIITNTVIRVNLGYFWNACLHSSIGIALNMMLISSFYWLCATVFRRKSFVLGTLILIAIEVAISILNRNSGLNLPSLFSHINWLIGSSTFMKGLTSVSLFSPEDYASATNWKAYLNSGTYLKFLYSSLFFAASYFVYQRRK